MNATQIRNQLEQKINEQQKVVDAGSISVDEANAFNAKIMLALESENVDQVKSIVKQMPEDAAAISSAAGYIERLKISLTQEMIHVPAACAYVITDGDLVSPSGFHADDRVFLKNEVFMMTDKRPGSLSGGLKAYKV
jgi:uncharacterized protein YaaQ